ncbi:hypothetical protein [Metapseudomonas sp. CR1201]
MADKDQIINSMCLTWRHDFGLDKRHDAFGYSGMTPDEREALRRRMAQLFEHHVAGLIAENERLRELPQDWLAADLVKQLVDNAQAFAEGADDGEDNEFLVVLLASAERLKRQEAKLDELNERLKAAEERLALVDLIHGRNAEERWANLNALCGERLAALQRVRDRLQTAGATLPSPDAMGTPESGLIQGLCIALALVEEELPKPTVSPLYARLREQLNKGGQGDEI